MTRITKMLSRKTFIALSSKETHKLKGGNGDETNGDPFQNNPSGTLDDPPPWIGDESP